MFTVSIKQSKIIKRLCITAALIICIGIAPRAVPRFGKKILNAAGKAAQISAITVMPSVQGEKNAVTTEYIKPETEGSAETTVAQGTSGTAKAEPSSTETTLTTTTTTSKAKSSNSNEKTYPVKEKQMKNTGKEYNGVWVRNTNDNHTVDIAAELEKKPDIKINLNSTVPQVLIVHTHTSECYQDEARGYYLKSDPTRTTDKSKNVVRVADEIEAKLESAGIKTVHVTTFHDYPKYNGAYSRTLETINSYLKKYPSIQVVLDIHRDSICADDGTKTKPTATINGKKAAQVMIISGCDDKGNLNFPDWELNLRFAVRLQKAMSEKYPGLARPVLFAPFRYNMHATHGSLLLEFGTEVNTLDEAVYSAQLVGECLAEVLTALQ